MALDKKLKNEAIQTMKLLGTDHDTWLNEQYSNFIDGSQEEKRKAINKILEENILLKNMINGCEIESSKEDLSTNSIDSNALDSNTQNNNLVK